MPEDSSLSVKVYLDVGGGRQEVRRFGMPEGLATNFSYLKDKVCSVFSLGNTDITLSWTDAEGDCIAISSDEELMEAIADNISRQNLQLLRVNVSVGQQPDPNPSNSSGNQQGSCHENVTCDGCEGRICGFRYRCLSCPDFDLCGACESKGLHKEHRMMRISKPLSKQAPHFFWREHEGPSGQYTSHFGMHGGDGSNGAAFSSTCTSGAGAGAGTWTSWGGPGTRHFHRRGFGGKGRGGWWGRNWGGRNLGGFAQSQSMNFGFGSQQQQQQQQQQHQQHQQQHQQHQQQHQQQGSGNSNKEDKCPWTSSNSGPCPFVDTEQVPSPQQVAEDAQQMAEEVAHHAHHFASHMASEQVANVMRGIWAAWTGQQGMGAGTTTTTKTSSSSSSSSSTSQQNDNEPKTEEKDQQQKGSTGEEYLRNVGETVAHILDPLGIDVEVSVENNGIRQRCSLGKNDVHARQSPTVSSTPSTPEEPDTPAKSKTSANMEVQTEAPQKPQTEGNDATTEVMDLCTPPETSQMSGEQMDAEQISSDTEDWTLVNQEASQERQANTELNTSSTHRRVEYPSLGELEVHPNPTIQRALEQMIAMGYSNEGGWLTYLLEMKQGDINEVVDLLQPVSK